MCAYANTTNKSAVRKGWDLPILTRWKDRIGHDLTYLGLPGPHIHDFRDWQDVLDPCRTGVEEVGRDKSQRLNANEATALLLLNVDFYGLSTGFELLRGDIEDIILKGYDSYGTAPRRSLGSPATRRFLYDLVNLDFDGGLGYPDKHGTAIRVSAIKKLFERQQGCSFVLLLTVNVRDTLGDEVEGFLTDLQTLERGVGWHELIEWHKQQGEEEREYKLKATIPSFIHRAAGTHMFRVTSHPPIRYKGHKQAHMVHFVFELESCSGNLMARSKQDDPDLVSLPLLEVLGGRLRFAQMQHPGFDPAVAEAFLQVLPEATQKEIMATAAGIQVVETSSTVKVEQSRRSTGQESPSASDDNSNASPSNPSAAVGP